MTEFGADLTFINLNRIPFTSQELAELFRHLPKVQTVIASHCSLDAAAVRVIANCPTVTSLDLWGNKIGLEGVEALLHPPFLSRLTALNLSRTLIDDAAISLLVQAGLPALKRLSLGFCSKITGKGVSEIATLPQLSELDLSDCKNFLEGDAAPLAQSKTLQKLNLSFTRLGDRDIQAFSESKILKLHELIFEGDVPDLGITSIGCQTIASSPAFSELITLNLQGSPIGDDMAIAIAQSPYLGKLQSLNLRDCSIGDKGALALASLSLTHLDLSRNLLTKAIAAALFSSHLRTLVLSENRIGDEGVQAIVSLQNLTQLELAACEIGEPGALLLASSLSSLKVLHLRKNPIGEKGAAALLTFPTLEQLNLDECSIQNIGPIPRSSNLKVLSLSHNPIHEEVIQAIITLLPNTEVTFSSGLPGSFIAAEWSWIRKMSREKQNRLFAAISPDGDIEWGRLHLFDDIDHYLKVRKVLFLK